MNTQIQSNAIQGQGSDNPNLEPRNLKREKAKNPNEISDISIKENPALYTQFISPRDMEAIRVISQVTKSESNVLISSQLNNEINPTMENKSVKGGDRIII